MEISEVVDNVVGELMKGFPKKIPRTMSVSGGNEDVRDAIVEKLHEKTGSTIKESSNGVYRISLYSFIHKYDPSLC